MANDGPNPNLDIAGSLEGAVEARRKLKQLETQMLTFVREQQGPDWFHTVSGTVVPDLRIANLDDLLAQLRAYTWHVCLVRIQDRPVRVACFAGDQSMGEGGGDTGRRVAWTSLYALRQFARSRPPEEVISLEVRSLGSNEACTALAYLLRKQLIEALDSLECDHEYLPAQG